MIKLIDLEVYKVAMEIGNNIWDIVDKWDFFNKDTLGKQFVKAADSVALNIAEGYGRYFYKENKNFNYYSRGSAFECTSCLRKAVKRNLITKEENSKILFLFEKYFRLVNAHIKSIGQISTKDQLQEPDFEYGSEEPQTLESLLTNDSMTNDL
ncbi:MAG: four helix bundle protein [Ginsengibacter sp.]